MDAVISIVIQDETRQRIIEVRDRIAQALHNQGYNAEISSAVASERLE